MSEELQVVPIEERISNELVKHNVTEAIIAKLREDYLPLKIAGIDDKETYLLVKEARKKCKEIRVLAKKICVDGREDAVSIQKAWVAKEKDVTSRISEVEDYLERQEKDYESAVAKEKEDRKRKQEEQLIMRQQILTNMGALYSDGSFHLGEVSFELSVVKESEPDIWEESILPKFKEEYEKVEAERIEQERIKQERESEMKRQQEELERKQKELEEKEAALKKAEEERLKKAQEEQLKKEAEERERINQLWRGRLRELGCRWDGHQAYARRDDTVVVATYSDLVDWTDEQFNKVLEDYRSAEAEHAEYLEQKRLAEIEAQKEAARKEALRKSRIEMIMQYGWGDKHHDFSSYSEEEWNNILSEAKSEYEKWQKEKWEAEQEEKRKQDELLEQQRMEQAKDKEKWDTIMIQLNSIVVYEMRSSQYRKKAMILREKLEEIKAL